MSKKPTSLPCDSQQAPDDKKESDLVSESDILNLLRANSGTYSAEISEELSAADNLIDSTADTAPTDPSQEDAAEFYLRSIAPLQPLSDDRLTALFEQYRSAQKEAKDLDQKENDILSGAASGGPAEFDEVRRQRKLAEDRAKRIRDEISKHNLKLVPAAVKTFHIDRSDRRYMDVLQSGNAGLMMAIQRYDHKLGYKFSTYAQAWIREGILSYLDSDYNMLSISSEMSSEIKKYRAACADLRAEQKAPNAKNAASKLGWSMRHTQKVIEASIIQGVESLNTTLQHDHSADIERAALVEDKASASFIYLTEDREMLEAVFNQYLVGTWADLMKRFYGFPPYTESQTHEEIGRDYGLGVKEIDAQLEKIALYLARCCRLNNGRPTDNE